MQCPPARASSRARLASSWPRTSARSGQGSDCGPPAHPRSGPRLPPVTSAASSTRGGLRRIRPPRLWRTKVAASDSEAAPTTSIPSASRLRRRPRRARRPRRTLRRSRATTIGSKPGRERSSPPSESSPSTAQRPLAETCSDPTRIPGRWRDPATRRSCAVRPSEVDGDSPGRILVAAIPDGPANAFSRLLKGSVARPTIVKPGRPGATSTSTRIAWPSSP